MSTLTTTLWKAVQERTRPEDVAREVLTHYPKVPHRELWRLRSKNTRSYMGADFAAVAPLVKSANIFATTLSTNFPYAPIRMLDEEESLGAPMTALLELGRKLLHIRPGEELNYRHGRLDRAGRAIVGLEMSRRQYDKLYRMLMFLTVEHEGNLRNGGLRLLLRGAKSALAAYLTQEEFEKDDLTAAFVAYMCARMNVRSVFTNAEQQKPFDDLASKMLDSLGAHKGANWFAVAHVFPRADVLKRLGDQEKFLLLTLSLQQMRRAAQILKSTAESSNLDLRKGCVVQRGQDSSTWNAAAGAWNKARDSWLSLSFDLGLDVTNMLPGKTPRLVAADVAYWHRVSGGQPHPDELIVAELPMPWEVLFDEAQCTSEMVRQACEKHHVNGMKTGWLTSRARIKTETWAPTPELVHGVTVADPLLGHILRKLNWFCGPSQAKRCKSLQTA